MSRHNMTHLEARAAMERGCRVSHRDFTSDEYLHKVGSEYHCEGGYVFSLHTAQLSGQDFFGDGWYIKKEPLLVAEYVCTTSDLIGVISEVNDISWNLACEVQSNDELYGQDGDGSMFLERGEYCSYSDETRKALDHIFELYPDVDSFRLVTD